MPGRLRAAAAILALAAGCSAPQPEVRSGEPPPARSPVPPAAPDGAGPADAEADQAIPRLIGDLDHPDDRVVFRAALELLDVRNRTRALAALAVRLDPKNPRPRQQRTILDAIAGYPERSRSPVRPELVRDLIPLVAPFLGAVEDALRDSAVAALAALDALEANDAKDPAHAKVMEVLDAPRDQGPSVMERRSAVRVIGAKTPVQAVPILMSAFRKIAILDVKQEIRDALQRITGRSFAGPADVELWWEANRFKTQDQWYRELRERDEKDKQLFRRAAVQLWKRLMQALLRGGSPEQHAAELRDALEHSEVPDIRVEAAKELLKTDRPDVYKVITAALLVEPDIEVKSALLRDALAERPPADAKVAAEVAERILPLVNDNEREIRRAAVTALGEMKSAAMRAVPRLLGRLSNRTRDSDVARAVLVALSKIKPPAEMQVTIDDLDARQTRATSVGRELSEFVRREIERAPGDTLRDPRLVEQAASTLGALEYGNGVPEAEKAAGLLVQLLDWNDPADARAAFVRTNAAKSLGEIGRSSSLEKTALPRALEDRDDLVAAEAARAIGAIAGGKAASDKEVKDAVKWLLLPLDGTREKLKDAALDAIRQVLKPDPQRAADPARLEQYREVALRLNQAKDATRVIRLLQDLPPVLPANAPAAARKTLTELRHMLATAYTNASPPDLKAAAEILEQLAKEDIDGFGEAHAAVLLQLVSEKADDVYAELIKRKPAGTEAPRWWGQRLELAKKVLDKEVQEKKEPRKARDLYRRMKQDERTMPESLKPELADLDRRIRQHESGAGERAGTVPGSVPRR